MDWLFLNRWFYRGGRPHALMRIVNRFWAWIHSLGILPGYMVTLQVTGRNSGRTYSLPIVLVSLEGKDYFVSMLGTESTWVKNVRATGGHAVMIHRTAESITLVEVPAEKRAPVLKKYLRLAPGARPHFPIPMNSSIEEFARIAPEFPVFRVLKTPPSYTTSRKGAGLS